jgi:hypothetical protein
MVLKDAAELVHFRELHLLPRTIFSIGAVCFIGSFFLKLFLLGFFGVGIVFAALALNFLIGVIQMTHISITARIFNVPLMIGAQLIICSWLAYHLLAVAHYYYFHGSMPPYLQPLSCQH